jgi:hypothetical protein
MDRWRQKGKFGLFQKGGTHEEDLKREDNMVRSVLKILLTRSVLHCKMLGPGCQRWGCQIRLSVSSAD